MDDPTGRRKFDVEFAPSAITDLEEIEDYVASISGFDAAQLLLESIIKRCYSLAIMPKAETKCDEIEPGLRSVTAEKRYVIYYRIGPARIEVARIRHGSRDTAKFFC